MEKINLTTQINLLIFVEGSIKVVTCGNVRKYQRIQNENFSLLALSHPSF